MENEAGYMTHVPTLFERFWRALGYRTRLPELSDEAERLPGWIMTEVHVEADWRDRLRFLLTGRALVRIETRTSEQVDAVSAGSFSLLPPGEPFPSRRR